MTRKQFLQSASSRSMHQRLACIIKPNESVLVPQCAMEPFELSKLALGPMMVSKNYVDLIMQRVYPIVYFLCVFIMLCMLAGNKSCMFLLRVKVLPTTLLMRSLHQIIDNSCHQRFDYSDVAGQAQDYGHGVYQPPTKCAEAMRLHDYELSRNVTST